jgi:hypothetical protein
MEFATPAGLDWDAPPAAVLPPLPPPHTCTPNFSLLLYLSTRTSKHHHHVSDPHYRSMLNPHFRLTLSQLWVASVVLNALRPYPLEQVASRLRIIGISRLTRPPHIVALRLSYERFQNLPLLPLLRENPSEQGHAQRKHQHAANDVVHPQ